MTKSAKPAKPAKSTNRSPLPSPDLQPVLDITGLALNRDGNRILRGIDWRIQPGEHWAILGANGSGKTSLLSTLTGYQTPTRGILRVLGQQYGRSNWMNLRTRIGIVSSAVRQQIPDYEDALITVLGGKYGMIDYWGTIKRADRAEALSILERTDAGHLAKRPWEVLSQGERQRILIGRALMAHPEILILDEPCAGLDPVAREHFLGFISRLAQEKQAPSLILVTHHVEEIVEEISHVLILKSGSVVAAGPKKQVLNSANLSEAFGAPVTLSRSGGRAMLKLTRPSARKVF